MLGRLVAVDAEVRGLFDVYNYSKVRWQALAHCASLSCLPPLIPCLWVRVVSPPQAMQRLNHFVTTELSSFYLDVCKDRLYVLLE